MVFEDLRSKYRLYAVKCAALSVGFRGLGFAADGVFMVAELF